jgi:hypothetical protein
MIPTEDEVVQLAAAIEHAIDLNGWDNTPALLLLLYGTDCPDPACGCARTLGVVGSPAQPHDEARQSDGDLMRGLRVAAARLSEGGDLAAYTKFPRDEVAGAFAGALLTFEGWATDDHSIERDRIADSPNAREVRYVLLADTAGRYVQLIRTRGDVAIRAYVWKPDDAEDMRDLARRPEAQAMRDVVLAFARNMPAGSYDADAVTRGVLAL